MTFSAFRLSVRRSIFVAAIAGLLTGCGGSGSTASTGGPVGTTQPPPPVTGVATPHSVSVVTAN